MDGGSPESLNFLSTIDPNGSLEAVLLLKRTGILIGAWTRQDMPLDIVAVMTGTLLGSVETLVQAMRCDSPRVVKVESESCQMLATKVHGSSVLVLIAPADMRDGHLRKLSGRIEARLSKPEDESLLHPVSPPIASARR